MMSLLQIKSVYKNFGGLQALSDISLDVEEGSISALIGPNGSGKTTLFNVITQLILHDSGEMFFAGERIDHLPSYLIPSKGIARTFQIISLFREAAVWENVASGLFCKTKAEIWSIFLRVSWMRSEEKYIKERTIDVLRFFGIEHLANRPAGMLPFGQQRLVELARGLVGEPKLLLLDEPLSGLNPREGELLQEKIMEIRNRGVTILFVEHEMKSVMKLAEKIVVLNFGKKIAEGTPEEIQNNPEVIEVYLGKETEIA
jgi:branched-chain amino acid transport system ATP-binding protein